MMTTRRANCQAFASSDHKNEENDCEPTKMMRPNKFDWSLLLLGEFFVDGLDEFVEVEGLFEDAAGAEEFRNVEEVLIPLRAGHGDDFCIEIFARQL